MGLMCIYYNCKLQAHACRAERYCGVQYSAAAGRVRVAYVNSVAAVQKAT